MSIASRITSIEEHIENAYDKIADLGIDLTNVDKNIDNIATELEEIYDEYPKVTATGVTEASLNGTKKGKMEIDIKGNTTQDSTTGKNLFDEEIEEGSLSDGQNVTGSAPLKRSKNYIAVTPNTEYAFSINSILNKVVINFYNTDKEWLDTTGEHAGLLCATGVFTTPSNCKYVRFRCYAADYNLFSNGKIQIEEGSTATAYEPYTGGEPAPSPSYPYPIKSCGDNVNLFNISTVTENKYVGGEDGLLYDSSSSNATDFIEVKENETVTLSYDFTSLMSSSYRGIVFYNSSKTYLSGTLYNPSDKVKNITIPANTSYIRITLDKNFANIKLEKGTVATPYSPYGCGNVDVKVQNKNLAILELGDLNYSTGLPSDSNSVIRIKNSIPLKNGDKIGYVTNLTNAVGIRRYNKAGVFLGSSTFSNVTHTFTNSSGETVYIKVRCALATGETLDTAQLQIEYGDPTTYVAHQEQNLSFPLAQGQFLGSDEELRDSSIDSIWDTYTFTGNENWTDYPEQTGDFYKIYTTEAKLGRTNNMEGTNDAFCSHFKNNKFYGEQNGIGLTKNATYVSISKTIASNSSELKSWFATQYTNGTPIKVLYKKANPTTTPYTQEQQTAYNQIQQAQSYLGQTNINSPDEVKPNMNLSALKGT